MHRYLIAIILILAPCAALGWWAVRAQLARAERDGAELAASRTQASVAEATARLTDAVARVDAVLGGLAACREGADLLRLLEAAPVPGLAAAAAISERGPRRLVGADAGVLPPPPSNPACRAARMLEASGASADALRAAWSTLALPGQDPEVRAEARAALVAVALGEGAEAARRALDAWIGEDPPRRLDAAAAFALAVPSAGAARVRIALASARRPVLAEGVRRRLWAAAGSDPVVAHLVAVAAGEAAAGAAWTSAGSPEGAGWRDLGDGRVLAWRCAGGTGGALLIAAEAWSVAAVPPPASGVTALITVPAPWGGRLEAAVPGDSAAWNQGRTLPVWAAFAAIVIALLGGISALVYAVARDRSLARDRAALAALLAHELKTPVALVRLHGDLLALDLASDEAARARSRQVIADESDRLARLVDDAAGLARASGRALAFTATDLAAVVGGVLEAARPRLAAAGFTVTSDLAADLPERPGDAEALGRAVHHLVDNAIKYARERRELAVTLHRDGGSAVIAIADRGPGLDPGEGAALFAAFRRGTASSGTRGAGLGLAVVRQVAEAHGGCAEAGSRPGGGAVFRIRLPVEG